MIDQFFQQAAEKIAAMLPQEASSFLSDLVSNNIFQRMTEQELRVACIKIALEALALAALIWITGKLRKGRKNKKEAATAPSTGKKFHPKKWKPDGTYYDEEKKKWIKPDFK